MKFMLTLIKNEIQKILGKKRSLIGFIAMGVLIPVIMIAFSYSEGGFANELSKKAKGMGGGFLVVGSIVNGYFIAHMIMNFLWVHIPFLITLVAGDVVAGEGAAGTFRIYLIRPVSRFKILLSKLLAVYIYTAALIIFFGLLSVGLGVTWHGTGDLFVLHDGILILGPETALIRFLLAYTLAIFIMFSVASLTYMFSSMVNNGIGPMVGAMAVIIISIAISNIPLDIFITVKPYLFTTYFDIWMKAFYDPVPWDAIFKGIGVLAIYIISFVSISFWIFTRKDILT